MLGGYLWTAVVYFYRKKGFVLAVDWVRPCCFFMRCMSIFRLAFGYRSIHFYFRIKDRIVIVNLLTYSLLLMIWQIHIRSHLFFLFWLISFSWIVQVETSCFSSSFQNLVIFGYTGWNSKCVRLNVIIDFVWYYMYFIQNWLEMVFRLFARLGIWKFSVDIIS